MKTVSVIVLAYRSADTIIQTLDSIKEQTYPDIELIVTDDCSPDNTVEVVRKWIKQNEGTLQKIKLVTATQNTGIPGSANRALAQATGVYMKVIAADDYLTKDAIAAYVAFCEKHPKSVPIAKAHIFSEGNADFSDVQGYCNRCYEFAKKAYKEQYRMLLMQNYIAAPSASFYPTQLIRDCGGYDEHYRWFEDYPMNLKVMHAGFGFGLIEKELVYYRMSSKSITASQSLRLKKAEMKLFFRQKMWYMIQNKMAWEAVKQSKSFLKIAFMK